MKRLMTMLSISTILLGAGDVMMAQPQQDMDVLEALVKGTGLSYLQFEGKERPTYVFVFKPSDATGIDKWLVRVAYNNENKSWICVSCTILDKDEGYEFPDAVKAKILQYNSQYPGSKFSWDKENGDIDVEWEMPTQFVTSALLAYMVKDVAATCDAQHDKLADLDRE